MNARFPQPPATQIVLIIVSPSLLPKPKFGRYPVPLLYITSHIQPTSSPSCENRPRTHVLLTTSTVASLLQATVFSGLDDFRSPLIGHSASRLAAYSLSYRQQPVQVVPFHWSQPCSGSPFPSELRCLLWPPASHLIGCLFHHCLLSHSSSPRSPCSSHTGLLADLQAHQAHVHLETLVLREMLCPPIIRPIPQFFSSLDDVFHLPHEASHDHPIF